MAKCLKTSPERPGAIMSVLPSSNQASHPQLKEQILLSPLVHSGSSAPGPWPSSKVPEPCFSKIICCWSAEPLWEGKEK